MVLTYSIQFFCPHMWRTPKCINGIDLYYSIFLSTVVDPLHESSSAAYSPPRVRRLDWSYQAPPNPYGFGGAYGENFLGDHYGETFRGYPQIHG